MPSPKNLLTITELGEVSFVDKGDNPPAGGVIFKAAPSTIPGGRVPDPVDVQKQIDEAVAAEVAKRSALEERIAKMEEAEAVAKVEGFCKSAHLPDELASPLRAVQKAAPAADFAKVQAELSRLGVALHKAQTELGQRIGGVGKGATPAMERLQKAADEVRKGRPELTAEQAMEKAINENPSLYNEVR